MIKKITNKTSQRQELSLIVGNNIQVNPGETIEIDEDTLYKEELERAKKFFFIDDVVINRQRTTRNGGKNGLRIKSEARSSIGRGIAD